MPLQFLFLTFNHNHLLDKKFSIRNMLSGVQNIVHVVIQSVLIITLMKKEEHSNNLPKTTCLLVKEPGLRPG